MEKTSKFDPEVASTTKKIFLLNICFTLIENIVFTVLGKWDITVLLGSLTGLSVTCGWYLLIILSVAKAMEMEPKAAQLYMQKSALLRTGLLGVCIFIIIRVPFLNWVAGIIPLCYTRISIPIINMKKGESEK